MKNKILIITSRLPYPPDQGDKLRLFNQIKQLSEKGHDITLISFFASKDELRNVPKLKEYCEVNIIYHPTWKSVLNCFYNIFSDTPFQVAYYSSTKFIQQINNVLKSKRFDIIHVHLIRMAQYVKNYSGGIPRILDLTDAGSLYLERFLKTNKQILYKFLLRVELSRLKKYENNLELFEKCLVCSSVDKEFLLRHSTKAKIDILYNGIDLRYFNNNNNDIKPIPFSIIFTGNMTYFPNADGIFYFVKEIFPLIEQELQDVKLYIVGKNPPLKIRKLAQHNINITGFVPDMRAYYLRSRVAIAPIRFGAGTLNKILEPIALGVPVVATSIGVEGLLLNDGTDLLVADSANDFANAVINILKDDELYRRLSENAMNIVHSLYDSQMIATQLESYYKEVIANL